MAPRPHNSGHYTIDACAHSQFDQQVRSLVGANLASTQLLKPVVMVNLLGDLWPLIEERWDQIINTENTKLYLYGKETARPGRKMGHFTCLADDVNQAMKNAKHIQKSLRS
jgi:5-(carboxyamino)imidazole ribonucleotide synthase